jgi:hypothetical protein
MIVLIDGDATIREFIKKIPDTLQATFITVNLLSAVELINKPNLKTSPLLTTQPGNAYEDSDVSKIDYLITELPPNNHELQAYKSQNITLL